MPKFIPPSPKSPYEKFVEWLQSKGWRPRWNGYEFDNHFFRGTYYGAIAIRDDRLYYEGIKDNDALDIALKLEEAIGVDVEYSRDKLITYGQW